MHRAEAMVRPCARALDDHGRGEAFIGGARPSPVVSGVM
jgi:hypothetical protein